MLTDARRTTRTWHDFLDVFVDDPELAARFKPQSLQEQSDDYGSLSLAAVAGTLAIGEATPIAAQSLQAQGKAKSLQVLVVITPEDRTFCDGPVFVVWGCDGATVGIGGFTSLVGRTQPSCPKKSQSPLSASFAMSFLSLS